MVPELPEPPDDPEQPSDDEHPEIPEAAQLGAEFDAPIDEDDLAPEDGAEEAEEEEEEEILFAKHKIASLDEIRTALDWAFETEDDLPPDFLDRCAEHAVLVQEVNTRMNVTKIVEPKEIAAKHYLDCWRTTRLLPLLGRAVLDAGTGAGYPGVVIALAEENARVVMIDSTKKKADFVSDAVDKMKIPNASCVWGRAEEHLLRNRYDVVVMRAISSVRENVRLVRKVRHSMYDLVMMKGRSWSREVRAGEREAERLGFRLDTILEHDLPDEMGQRAVLVYRAPGGQGR